MKILAAARQNAPWRTHTTAEHLGVHYVRGGRSVDLLSPTLSAKAFTDQVPSAKLPSFWQNHDKSNSSRTPFRRRLAASLVLRRRQPTSSPRSKLRFDPDSPFLPFSDSFATRDRDVHDDEYSRRETSPPNRDRDTLWILSWRSWRKGQKKKCRDFSRQHLTHNWGP